MLIFSESKVNAFFISFTYNKLSSVETVSGWKVTKAKGSLGILNFSRKINFSIGLNLSILFRLKDPTS